jgi:hypothetical protein
MSLRGQEGEKNKLVEAIITSSIMNGISNTYTIHFHLLKNTKQHKTTQKQTQERKRRYPRKNTNVENGFVGKMKEKSGSNSKPKSGRPQ